MIGQTQLICLQHTIYRTMYKYTNDPQNNDKKDNISFDTDQRMHTEFQYGPNERYTAN